MPRALSVVLLVIVSFGQLAAQDGESNALDLRTRKAIQVFVKDAMEIAIEYEQNGDLQKATSKSNVWIAVLPVWIRRSSTSMKSW